jgi:sugar phosphate isomerase/epimerase
MTVLSMNQVTTYHWSLENDVENYRRAGYRSIGVWRRKLQDLDEDRAIDLLAGSGLCVSSLCCAGGFTGAGGVSLQDSIDDAAMVLRWGAAMQAGCLVIHPGNRNNHTARHACRLLRMALDALLPLAEDCEVPLALEPMHPACASEWTFLTDLDSALAFLDLYRSPYLKLACDTYHFPWERPDREALEQIAAHLGIVYLSDRRHPPSIDQDRYPLGSGHLPLSEIVTSLIDAGYAGPFDVRLIGPEIEAGKYWEILRQSQVAFAEMLSKAPTQSFA